MTLLRFILPILFSVQVPLQREPESPIDWDRPYPEITWRVFHFNQREVLRTCSDVIQFDGNAVVVIVDPREAEILRRAYADKLKRDQDVRWFVTDK